MASEFLIMNELSEYLVLPSENLLTPPSSLKDVGSPPSMENEYKRDSEYQNSNNSRMVQSQTTSSISLQQPDDCHSQNFTTFTSSPTVSLTQNSTPENYYNHNDLFESVSPPSVLVSAESEQQKSFEETFKNTFHQMCYPQFYHQNLLYQNQLQNQHRANQASEAHNVVKAERATPPPEIKESNEDRDLNLFKDLVSSKSKYSNSSCNSSKLEFEHQRTEYTQATAVRKFLTSGSVVVNKVQEEVVPKKRQRTKFTYFQLMEMRKAFEENEHLTKSKRKYLALRLNLAEDRVKVWFQNQKQKVRKERVGSAVLKSLENLTQIDNFNEASFKKETEENHVTNDAMINNLNESKYQYYVPSNTEFIPQNNSPYSRYHAAYQPTNFGNNSAFLDYKLANVSNSAVYPNYLSYPSYGNYSFPSFYNNFLSTTTHNLRYSASSNQKAVNLTHSPKQKNTLQAVFNNVEQYPKNYIPNVNLFANNFR